MGTSFLTEYRCVCGKLLFRALVLLSIIEIKCKRCNMVSTIGMLDTERMVTFDVGGDGNIVDVIGDSRTVRCEREYLIGKQLTEVCPLLNDKEKQKEFFQEVSQGRPYAISSNILVLKDGGTLLMETCLLPRKKQEGKLAGYRVFNCVKK